MLKALELNGFKSFADKTRLEFPPGITVVVGPNGSGKSNIVDAIKWVLGEQSVKSLRGKEMADVIFNGSSTRRPLNAAETTLTFDNSQRLLAIDTPEVHITRRVYRSGEGEYLINRQPCRLRDIRDLFAGTGAATEAYSVIEQGKVDVLLQSSPRDRRLIFEEAAGISRFKAKKLEAIRRLERVDQNLLRLSDIVDEVDSRVRTVRMQASKARKYKEYSDRLQALRTQIGAADWRKLTERLEKLEAELRALQEENLLLSAQAETLETQAFTLDTRVAEFDGEMRNCEAQIAQNRERIAAHESSIEHERRRSRDLEEEVARSRRQLTSMSTRAIDLQQQIDRTTASVNEAEQQHLQVARRLAEEERQLTQLTAQVDELRAEHERRRANHLQQMRVASSLASQVSALESKVAATDAARGRAARRLAELQAARQTLATELEQREASAARLATVCEQHQAALETVQAELANDRALAAEAQQQSSHLRERLSGAGERATVLGELEKRLEGVSAGVKQLLADAQADPTQRGGLRGIVADLLHVSFETAPAIEVALGDAAQCLVVADVQPWIERLQTGLQLEGRVGFLRLEMPASVTAADAIDLTGYSGVVARADMLVQCDADVWPLAQRLLGRTWLVETLEDALRLAEGPGRGLQFVTRRGELLAADGSLHAGPRHASTGLISRRSELRVLEQQIAELNEQIATQADVCQRLEAQVTERDQQLQRLAAELRQANEQYAQERSAVRSASERLAQLDRQQVASQTELEAAEAEYQKAVQTLAATKDELQTAEATLAELEAGIQQGRAGQRTGTSQAAVQP
jgi:chromosome segregation protein